MNDSSAWEKLKKTPNGTGISENRAFTIRFKDTVKIGLLI